VIALPLWFGTFSLALASSLVAFGMFRVFGDGGRGRAVAPRKPWPARSAKGLPAAAPSPDADEPQFEFSGRHLLASYSACDPAAIRDTKGLVAALHAAVKASGATLLESTEHVFPPDGMTAVVLLSESHASIHTYPEHQSCFVDIFTCGGCKVEAFDAVLRSFLRPRKHSRRIITRHEEMVDESSADANAA
jgi:S-adenosylmethionine decarboxylase